MRRASVVAFALLAEPARQAAAPGYIGRMVKFTQMALLLPGCWFTDSELAAALGRADTDTDTDTDTEPYTCVRGESDPDTDEPADYTGTAGMRMIGIPSGSFCMGNDVASASSDEQPVHPVTLTRPFWIGNSEVTQAQYEALTGETPSYHVVCDDCPVEGVSWYEAATLANAVSDAEGLDRCYTTAAEPEPVGDPYGCEGYRLPTEAEWEYAARAGEEYVYAGSNNPFDVAWTNESSGGETHPVCELADNGFGLCDMSGNVWEWTNDGYEIDYYSTSPAEDPPGPSSGSFRVIRGGGFSNGADGATVSYRHDDSPGNAYNGIGFRLSRSIP